MRKALALLATIGAVFLLSTGVASAQYQGTTTSTTPGTETVTPTTAPPAPTTAPPATAPGAGVGGAGAGTLPATGSESLPLAQIAIVLVAAGGIALIAARRHVTA